MTGKFLTAKWQYLAMLNYEVDPAILRPFVPSGTELDEWRGRTFVSIVGFLFLDTRVRGIAVPFHRDFEEVNLRFYVRRLADDGWRRGVVFVKEIVPRTAIAAVARLVYNENYVARRMRNSIDLDSGVIEYGWREDYGWNSISVRIEGDASRLVHGSEEEFITEHYWGYAAQRDGKCVEYQVEHPPWLVWQVSESRFDCDVASVYGKEFVEYLRSPSSAFVAQGSPVTVRQGRTI